MPDSTLDARIAEARKEADETYLRINTRVDFDNQEIIAHLVPEWLTAFAEHLLASERSARAEVEAENKRLVEWLGRTQVERDAVREESIEAHKAAGDLARDNDDLLVKLRAAERELTALRSQVASAKREGREWFRKGWNRFAEVAVSREVIKAPCPNLEHPPYVWRICGIEPDAEFDRLYPDAPATPPERVSGRENVRVPIAFDLKYNGHASYREEGDTGHIAITPEIAKRIVALAGGAE